MGTYVLVNVEDRRARYPSFEIPSLEDRQLLQPGDAAQLVFDGKERMWVVIKTIKSDFSYYSGILVNNPVSVDVRHGDVVAFEPKHVAKIMYGKGERRCSRA